MLMIVCLLATTHSRSGQVAEITASPDGRSLLTKWYRPEAGSPDRDYVLSHRSTAGKWLKLPLGAFGNEDYEQDYLTSSDALVFIAIGTQVGYSVPLIVLMNDKHKKLTFVDGGNFSFEVAWWQEYGVAFIKGHVVFLCQVKDKKCMVVSDGVTLKSAVAPEEIVWVGACGDSLLYRTEKGGTSAYRSSSKLPTFSKSGVDMHFDSVFKCEAIAGG
jgi:hypothetical protein